MKRRLLSLVLALVMTLCLIPVSAFAAQPTDTSDACISVIKYFEGFAKYPFWDHSQYTVGYGTRCPDDKLSYYQKYGITESEAVALLKKELNNAEYYVSNFADTNGLDFTQSQFDALVSFTYNVGSGWMRDAEGLMTRAVINGTTGNDFIFAMTMWCTASGEVLPGLVTRRLIESNMYLNGVYSTAVPAHYGYVSFNHSGCIVDGESRTVRIQGYDASQPVEVYPEGVKSGYRFLGWYTASTGGKRVTHLDATTNGLSLYARWQSGDGSVKDGKIQGTAASYERAANGTVKVYSAPSTSAAVVYTLADNTMISVVADYVDANGVMWCRLADGNWLRLSDTDVELTPAENTAAQGYLVTITANSMNVRSGPGTGYSVVRLAYKGEQVRITEVKNVSGTDWGKFDGGWICLDYTDYYDVKGNGEVVATGTINLKSGYLNVRAGAGYDYDVVNTLSAGARVSLYEIVTADGTKWGRIDQGWISMYYVDLDEELEGPSIEETTEPTTEAPTEAPTQAPTEASTEAPTQAPTEAPTEPPVDEGKKPIATGTVNITSGYLNVRGGAGSGYTVIDTLKKGAKVEIFEYKTVSGTKWGRVSEKGWVSMSYIKLDPVASEPEKPIATGTVNTVSGPLNVRSGPGTNYTLVTRIAKGTAVNIYETKTVGSVKWGRIDQGWVSMSYIKLNTTGEDKGGQEEETKPVVTSGTRTGTVINCNEVNVRSGAGTGYSKVGTIKAGTKLTFTELKMVSGTAWGKCSKGWVCLDYVKLDGVSAGSLVLIDAYGLNIRSGAGTSYSKVGTYNKGEVVVVLETKKVGSTTWAKSAKGWFSLAYAI